MRTPHGSGRGTREIVRYSPRLVSAFTRYLRRYLRRSFNAIRVAGAPPALDVPTVIYSNHAAWWDPVVLMLVLRGAYPERRFHAPMDRGALERYPFFERLGAFGVSTGCVRAGFEFVRGAKAVLVEAGDVLCVTAEGRFMDPRARPVRLERGVTHLLQRGIARQAVPIAVEYPFWHERRPEALLQFGTPLRGPERTSEAQHARLEAALERTLDELSERSVLRNAGEFETLLDGTRGVGGVYDVYRWARARATGRRFDAAHRPMAR